MFQQLFFPPLAHQVGVADVTLFQRAGAPHQEVYAVHGGQLFRHRADGPPNGQGDMVVPGDGERLLVDVVTAKELVRALAGQADLHLLGRFPVHKIEGHAGGIRQRLVHVVLDAGQILPVFLRLDAVGVVLHAHEFAELGSVVGFVVLLVGKAHGEGLVHMGKVGHVAGVHAGGQEGAHLHVADLVGGHALAHDLFHPAFPVGKALAFLRLKAGLPVALHIHLPGLPQQTVGGQQLFHAFEKGILPRGILVAEIQLQLALVQLLFEAGMGQKALDLAAEEQLALIGKIIVEGLDTEVVPGTEQGLLGLVPDGKGEHTPQLRQHAFAPFLVAVEQNLGV